MRVVLVDTFVVFSFSLATEDYILGAKMAAKSDGSITLPESQETDPLCAGGSHIPLFVADDHTYIYDTTCD